jgi:hypothetical protein
VAFSSRKSHPERCQNGYANSENALVVLSLLAAVLPSGVALFFVSRQTMAMTVAAADINP